MYNIIAKEKLLEMMGSNSNIKDLNLPFSFEKATFYWRKGYISANSCFRIMQICSPKDQNNTSNTIMSYEEYEAVVRDCVETEPQNIGFRSLLIQILINRGKHNDALIENDKAFQEVSEDNEDYRVLYSKKLIVLSHLRRYEEAENLAREVLEKGPDDVITDQLIEILARTKKYDEALVLARELPDDLGIRNIISRAKKLCGIQQQFMQAGTKEALREYFAKVQKQMGNRKTLEVAYQLSKEYKGNENIEALIGEVRSAIIYRTKKCAINELIVNDELGEALIRAQELHEQFPLNEEATFNYIFLLYANGDNDKAEKIAAELKKAHPDDESVLKRLNQAKEKATSIKLRLVDEKIRWLMNQRKFSEAYTILRTLHHTYPDNIRLAVRYMNLSLLTGNLEEAVAIKRKILVLAPNDEDILEELNITANRLKPEIAESKVQEVCDLIESRNFAEAILKSKTLYELDPTNKTYALIHIKALRVGGELDKSKKVIETAACYHPHDAEFLDEINIESQSADSLQANQETSIAAKEIDHPDSDEGLAGIQTRAREKALIVAHKTRNFLKGMFAK